VRRADELMIVNQADRNVLHRQDPDCSRHLVNLFLAA
jgi:hypothetical protein